jgi:hypothetical protein
VDDDEVTRRLEWDPDFFAAYVASIAEATCRYELDVLKCIDKAVGFLFPPGHPEGRLDKDRRKALCHLMALRHEYLDDTVYGAMHEAAGSAITKPRVFLCTISFLQKLQGGLSSWSKTIKELHRMILLVDEYHHLSVEGLLAALAAFDAVIVSGDNQQAPVAEWFTNRQHAEATAVRASARATPRADRAASSAGTPDDDDDDPALPEHPLAERIRGGDRRTRFASTSPRTGSTRRTSLTTC